MERIEDGLVKSEFLYERFGAISSDHYLHQVCNESCREKAGDDSWEFAAMGRVEDEHGDQDQGDAGSMPKGFAESENFSQIARHISVETPCRDILVDCKCDKSGDDESDNGKKPVRGFYKGFGLA